MAVVGKLAMQDRHREALKWGHSQMPKLKVTHVRTTSRLSAARRRRHSAVTAEATALLLATLASANCASLALTTLKRESTSDRTSDRTSITCKGGGAEVKREVGRGSVGGGEGGRGEKREGKGGQEGRQKGGRIGGRGR